MHHAIAWIGRIECALEHASDGGEERGDVFVVVLSAHFFREDELGDAVADMFTSRRSCGEACIGHARCGGCDASQSGGLLCGLQCKPVGLIVALGEIEQLQKRWHQHDARNQTVVLFYELLVDVHLLLCKMNGSWSLLYLRRGIRMIICNHHKFHFKIQINRHTSSSYYKVLCLSICTYQWLRPLS